MILDGIFPLPIRVADGGRLESPVRPDVGQGPPRYARVTCTKDGDLSGHLVFQAPCVAFDQGWLDTVWAMGIHGSRPDPWRALCWRHGTFDGDMPWLHENGLTTAWITRDAVGWSLGEHRIIERIADNDRLVWPWHWLRPRTSAHQHAERVRRLLEDVAWMARTTTQRTHT